jgi:hypothetical protein
MSLEIDWQTFKKIASQGVYFESKGAFYLIIQGILLTVQPSREEYDKQEEEISQEISNS